MIYTKEALLEDISAFADLGADAPQIIANANGYVARLVREGRQIELSFNSDGAVIERCEGEERRHVNIRSLLASPLFANIGKWADSQRLHLKERVSKETIPVTGLVHSTNKEGGVDEFDIALMGFDHRKQFRTNVFILNGPAGIGKTSLIRSLAFRRADQFRRSQKHLILHVESRGRMLQNITDLMAFSLQTLRLSVTYDQVPALVRNGLITLAIDGFDELGDPNGYDLAWAQVNDLIISSRGNGTIILAGRETFIRKERMISALQALDETVDRVDSFSLLSPTPYIARNWLKNAGWPERILELEVASPLFEEESYALRPFFLSELSRKGVAEQIENGQIEDLLSFLIDSMTEREAQKFGRDVEAVTTEDIREKYITSLMEEVARDLAENQSDAISSDTLSWLSEMVASEIVPHGLIGILKNRAGVIAFLTEDDRRGYRRFIHEQVLNYYLSKVTIKAIISNEVPKFVRRNIFGVDFLESFCSVARYADQETVDGFIDAATTQLNSIGDHDRARRNLGALILGMCSVCSPSNPPSISDLNLEEAYLSETVSSVSLKNVTIGQLYAKGADCRNVDFHADCNIVSLVSDDGTVLPRPVPFPSSINLRSETITDPRKVVYWVNSHIAPILQNDMDPIDTNLSKSFGLLSLYTRIVRYKPFWIKDGDERGARRILDDPYWEKLKELMIKHNLLVVRHDVPASGRPAPFYHVRNRQILMNHREVDPSKVDPAFFEFLRELVVEILKERSASKK